VVVALHAELPREIADGFAAAAGLELAPCNEWDEALSMLERAYRDGAASKLPLHSQSELWKFAYLHGHVETAMPRLAAIPFNRDFPTMAENGRWQLLAYRIRSGRTDLTVPVLDRDNRSLPYLEAAALQVVRLETIAAAADTVRKLRAALPSRPVE